MRWSGKGSSNIEDNRSGGSGGKVALGGGAAIIIVILGLIMGKSPMELLSQVGVGEANQQENVIKGAPADEQGKFVANVLESTEIVWTDLFKAAGTTYEKPVLRLFRDQQQSACGFATAATGPFYCPADKKVYIDLAFYDELKNRFGAPGDFAQAYVIAHEVGHHVQNLLGVTDKVDRMRSQLSESDYNKLSVRLELQADFYAGVWAHHAQQMNNILEEGDIEEALNAANAIGDDRLQKQSSGEVVPDAFTHGTSVQRMRWFKKGFDTGDMEQGDTFNSPL
ncbi:MAG: neutral zinc metallopeptidase [Sphingobacteriaceae bacterium]